MSEQIHELDARGLNCPLPILRLKKMLAQIESGEVVRMLATDPGSLKDSESFCKQTGNTLLSTSEKQNSFEIEIRKQ
jgi:tRNA 2-thiouridine synthesizing protein A